MADPEVPLERVRALLAADGPDPGELRIEPIPGGASREVMLVRAVEGDARWVLRRDPPGAQSFIPLIVETALLAAAGAAGAPVPRAGHYEGDGGAYGTPGFLMDFVPGDSVATRVLRRDHYEAARAALPAQLGAALARIHSIDPAGVEGLQSPDGDPALGACELWEAELDRIGEPLPVVEAGLRWLRLNRPPTPQRVTLVHGDYRLGNFIVDESGLAAVIDWELAHGGDPAEDIGWLMIRSWRFGNDELPVAGVGPLDAFLDAYEAAGGDRPSDERLLWWEAMGNIKWAVICARQARDHLDGIRPSHELASLGRRICEPEWDLLQLISRGAPSAGDGEVGSGEGKHPLPGYPDAAELLDATAAYLFTELRPRIPKEERFRLLVAANVCAVVAREVRAGAAPALADARLFTKLVGAEPAEPTEGAAAAAARHAASELARELRAGGLDDRLDGVLQQLEAHVRRQLEIGRPGYAD